MLQHACVYFTCPRSMTRTSWVRLEKSPRRAMERLSCTLGRNDTPWRGGCNGPKEKMFTAIVCVYVCWSRSLASFCWTTIVFFFLTVVIFKANVFGHQTVKPWCGRGMLICWCCVHICVPLGIHYTTQSWSCVSHLGGNKFEFKTWMVQHQINLAHLVMIKDLGNCWPPK